MKWVSDVSPDTRHVRRPEAWSAAAGDASIRDAPLNTVLVPLSVSEFWGACGENNSNEKFLALKHCVAKPFIKGKGVHFRLQDIMMN